MKRSTLAVIHAASQADAERALNRLRSAITLADSADIPGPVIVERLTAGGRG